MSNPSSRFYLRPDLRQTRPTCRNLTPSIWPSWFLQHVPSLISPVFGNVFHNKTPRTKWGTCYSSDHHFFESIEEFLCGIPLQKKILCYLFFSPTKYKPKWSRLPALWNTPQFVFVQSKELFYKTQVIPWIQIRKDSRCLYKIPNIQIGSPLPLEHLPLCDVEWDFGESLQKILRIAERRRFASLWRVLAKGKDKGNRWGSNVNIYQPLLGTLLFSF